MAEDELHEWYTRRRQEGYRVTKMLLRVKMKEIVLNLDDPNYDPLKNKFGTNWVDGFCRRKKISLQRRTNNKSRSIYEKLHRISSYHTWLIYMMADPERDYPRLVHFGKSKPDYEEDFAYDNDTLESDGPSEDESSET